MRTSHIILGTLAFLLAFLAFGIVASLLVSLSTYIITGGIIYLTFKWIIDTVKGNRKW